MTSRKRAIRRIWWDRYIQKKFFASPKLKSLVFRSNSSEAVVILLNVQVKGYDPV
jgi:hypothetical protein